MANSGKFRKSAEKTIAKLCEQIERYFKDFKIKTKVTSKIEWTMELKKHKCKVYDCVMIDVVVRNGREFRCRRCGKRLRDFEIKEAIFEKIKGKLKKQNGKKRRKTKRWR